MELMKMKILLSLLLTVQLIIGFETLSVETTLFQNGTAVLFLEQNGTTSPSSLQNGTEILFLEQNGTRLLIPEQNNTATLPSGKNYISLMPIEQNTSLLSSDRKFEMLSDKNTILRNFLQTGDSNLNHATRQNTPILDLNGTFLHITILNRHNFTTLDEVSIMTANSSRLFDEILKDIRKVLKNNDSNDDPFDSNFASGKFSVLMNISHDTVTHNELNIDFSSFYILTHHFKCNLDKNDELTISCKNVSIYSLTQYLPNNTVRLEITDSPTVTLTKPLFSYSTKLTYLRLSNNQHRFITRAFTGLQSLQYLDLSDNNIMAVKYAFSYLSNLKYLNLSKNSFITIEVVANALEGLKHLEILVLDHNWRIFRIRKNELKPLSNSNITKLHLFNTTMSIAERGAFEHLTKLEVLDLSVNYLNEEALTNVTSSLKNAPIRYLFLQEWVHLNVFPSESLKFLENTSIQHIYLSRNYFIKIHKLPYIPSLQSLWIDQCSVRITDNDLISQLPNLTVLVLSGNNFLRFNVPSSRSLKILQLSRQLTRYEMKEFEISGVFAFKNTPELEFIDFTSNLFPETLYRYDFFGLHKLKRLILSDVDLVAIEDYAFETLGSLEILDLSHNRLRYLSNATLFGLHKLTDLYLSNNHLILPDELNPFQQTPLLTIILLNNNRIEKLPKGIFNFTDHLELLILSQNKIHPWDEPIFGENLTVNTLGLSQNYIDYVTPTMLSEFQKNTSYLDISRNPFNCSNCGLRQFQAFLKSTPIQMGLPYSINKGIDLVKCSLPNKLVDQSLVVVSFADCSEFEKLLSLSFIVLISVGSIFFIMVACFCYSFRWYIRYWVFHVQSKFKERRTSNRKSERVYKYDAFISYNSNDTSWIASSLIPALERQDPKLKLCIHDRDFEVGRFITENILEAIENSRKVILILTEEFVKSEWCMFELHMAQHRLFDETRDCLILIKLKKVDKKFYTKHLKYLEKTRTCILWPDTLTDQHVFWEKIRKLLGNTQPQNEYELAGFEI
ncbi:toll-like receptor 6 [Parasteatoda tepidariorum]|uniref:toll-like receptor 6 n=1 Tax=Parasteatoda tepidariorum TaxID=114398 RepID=UPI0039BCD4B5